MTLSKREEDGARQHRHTVFVAHLKDLGAILGGAELAPSAIVGSIAKRERRRSERSGPRSTPSIPTRARARGEELVIPPGVPSQKRGSRAALLK